MDEATRASLAVLLLALLSASMWLPSAALARRVPQPPPVRPAGVRAFILELPRGLPRSYRVVALVGGRVVPALALPYPLRPFKASRAREVLVDGKPLGRLLGEDPGRARRLLAENRGVRVVTAPVQGLAWSPGSGGLLVIVPAGGSPGGERLGARQLAELRASTAAIYRGPGGVEIRLVAPTGAASTAAAPPLIPPVMNDTVFGYSVSLGAARLDVDITPGFIEELVGEAKLLKPAATASTRLWGGASAWEVPYTLPLAGGGLPRSVEAAVLESGSSSAGYSRCWDYTPLPGSTAAAASATLKPLVAGYVSLTVTISYAGGGWPAPLAWKSYRGYMGPGQAVTLLAQWRIPAGQRGRPPRLRVCVDAGISQAGAVPARKGLLYVTHGGYLLVDAGAGRNGAAGFAYTATRSYAAENGPGAPLAVDISRTTTLPVASVPSLAPGPVTVLTYVERGAVDLYLGGVYLGRAAGPFWASLDTATALAALSPYVLTGKAAPLTMEPLGGGARVDLELTSIAYPSYMLAPAGGGAGAYRLASGGDYEVVAEPALLHLVLADDGTLLEAGEAAVTLVAERPAVDGVNLVSALVDLAVSTRPYSLGVRKLGLWIRYSEPSATISYIGDVDGRVTGSSVVNRDYQAILWLMGAAGLALGAGAAVGVVSGTASAAAQAASHMLSVAATALSEPHVYALLGGKTLPVEASLVGSDTVVASGGADSGLLSSWRRVLYRASLTLEMRGSRSPVEVSTVLRVGLGDGLLGGGVVCRGYGGLEVPPR